MRNRSAAIVMAALAAAMTPGAIGVMPIVARDHDAPEPMKLTNGHYSNSSPNGGRRHTVAQDRRAALKHRNRLRAKGQHRKAVR